MAAVDGEPTARATGLDAVQRAFEAAGIQFHDGNNGGPRVRLVERTAVQKSTNWPGRG